MPSPPTPNFQHGAKPRARLSARLPTITHARNHAWGRRPPVSATPSVRRLWRSGGWGSPLVRFLPSPPTLSGPELEGDDANLPRRRIWEDSQRLKTMGVLPFAPSILGAFKTTGPPIESRHLREPPKPTSPTAVRNTVESDSEIAVAAEKAWRECLDIDPALYLAQLINLRGPGRTHPSHAARASRFARFPVRDLTAGRVCRHGRDLFVTMGDQKLASRGSHHDWKPRGVRRVR
ncbi:hypothetical protein B0T18DRAFT_418957 [Schizothecium vesticola]|uniref:Uncharacterized protein n=1 Tax=Schizothecium vesticola TaxID=314040 RepID=A0AA40EKB6_9PEZI|nr:hypothetical protein B0T18DRAFT_418957 [Schizothecium vesticola]